MGMSHDLGLTKSQYYNCLMMFCKFSVPASVIEPTFLPNSNLLDSDIGYIVFMLPGNIGLRVLPPHYVLGGSALLFGAFLTSMAGAQGYETAISMRILIGSAQAFIQGLGLYASMWYKRDEVATRGGESTKTKVKQLK